ncbi:GDSL esterase/lipase At2g31550-like [Ananas comosus]|uniref:GDSL esterase/lipase At2g31550-like n=1 Tax=Ananas comosus TaxID=4615 RepID=A0A6P5G0B9_ANACO|nr:GDSL esterase/lipase At2g31550-like [Ananas comosus]
MSQPLLLLSLLFLLFSMITTTKPQPHSNFSAAFYFGDSTLDTGNNAHISTLVAANHFPYGTDFLPGHNPTGRFSNGRLVPDLLSSKLGLRNLSPPFLDPQLSDRDDVLKGANFASAGSGFDDVTSAVTNTIPIARQLELFKVYLGRLRKVAGEEEASRIVGSGLVLISAGTNDFLINFYDLPSRRLEFSIGEYQDFVLKKVESALKELYKLGGRLFAVAGLPPIGCIPLQITLHHSFDRTCVEEENADSVAYNVKLQKLLLKLQQTLPGSKFVYMNSYDALSEILNNPSKYGFEETKRGCCGTGLTEVGPLCNFLTPTCQDASSFVFYDAVHPSEKVYRLATDYILEHVIPHLRV